MNARQAAKSVAKKIEEMEDTIFRYSRDVKAYNQCIASMIDGGDPCVWCEDRNECQRECKGKGCQEWWLAYDAPIHDERGEDDADGTDQSEGVLSIGAAGGEGA